MLISSARIHWLILGAGLALLACGLDSAQGQNQGGGGGNLNFNSNLTGNFVGGIAIRPDGVIERQSEPLDPLVRQQWLETFQKQKDVALEARVDRRMVSLRGLHAALEASVREGTPLPDAVCFLGGLQRVEYVFLDPERHDVVLAGPGEGWTVDAQGNVVGVTNGQPVLRLEDLIVALRTAENAQRDQGISCSINPTAEGAAALAQLERLIGTFSPEKARQVEQLGGPQVITLTGLPTDSRFSQILVAADYKMKRISMGFEPAAVEGLPSFIDMVQAKGTIQGTSSPRFWMECQYDALGHSEDGLAWRLSGPGVKTLTEDGYIAAGGERRASGKTNRLAEKWAESMSGQFEKLAAADPVFAELRNAMDLAVVAALIARENMLSRVELDLPLMVDAERLKLPTYHAAKTVPTQCSFVKLTSSWLVTASGGVQVDSWGVVENRQVAADLSSVRTSSLKDAGNAWWWN